MPGKHAPKSSRSFLSSLARAIAGALAAVGLVVLIVLIAITSRGDDPGSLAGSPSPRSSLTRSPSPSATQSSTQSSTLGPSPSPSDTVSEAPEPPIPKDKLRVEVLNGNGREGAAGEVADRLLDAGYTRVTTGNANIVPRTTIYYRGALRREAQRLLREFPELKRIREATSSTPGSARLTVVLGTDHEPPA